MIIKFLANILTTNCMPNYINPVLLHYDDTGEGEYYYEHHIEGKEKVDQWELDENEFVELSNLTLDEFSQKVI